MAPQKISTLIFDVDDTLYDVGTGFTAHRNGGAVAQFMVEKLGFSDIKAAQALRDEYFELYHSTAKALTVAEEEGKFPPMERSPTPRFRAQDLAEYWANNLDYSLLGGEKKELLNDLIECKKKLNLVAFSNGPRKYVKRVLIELGLFQPLFGEERLFAVDDVLPSCKPEKEAFEKVFSKVGVTDPTQCIMIEDSMKNIRRAKELGMKTVLVMGTRRGDKDSSSAAADAAEATKPGDTPDENDPAVDVAVERAEEIRKALPGLWDDEPVFRLR